jgi:hypothetical protein
VSLERKAWGIISGLRQLGDLNHSRPRNAAAEGIMTMRDFSIMSALMNADPDLAVLREDLTVLTRDVASLFEHMKCGATLGAETGGHPLQMPQNGIVTVGSRRDETDG